MLGSFYLGRHPYLDYVDALEPPPTPWGWVTWGWVTSTPRLLGWVTRAHGQLSLSKMSRAPRLEGMAGKTLALRVRF